MHTDRTDDVWIIFFQDFLPLRPANYPAIRRVPLADTVQPPNRRILQLPAFHCFDRKSRLVVA